MTKNSTGILQHPIFHSKCQIRRISRSDLLPILNQGRRGGQIDREQGMVVLRGDSTGDHGKDLTRTGVGDRAQRGRAVGVDLRVDERYRSRDVKPGLFGGERCKISIVAELRPVF